MKRITYIFPGQGSQRTGIFSELYQESNLIRETFQEASEMLGYDVHNVCMTYDKVKLSNIAISSPIILTLGVAAYRHITQEYKLKPAFMAGHSLGEYTALTCAGCFSFKQALDLVQFRAQLAQKTMQETNGIMVVVYNIDSYKVERLCLDMRKSGCDVWISCYNSNKQVCVVGKENNISIFEKHVNKEGASAKRMNSNAPFHSPLMNSVTGELKAYLEDMTIAEPNCTIFSNYYTKPYSKENAVNNLVQQFVSPVMWVDSVNRIIRQNIDAFIELGAGNILKDLIHAIDPTCLMLGYEKSEDREKIYRELINYSRN